MRLLKSTTFWVISVIMGILYYKMPETAGWVEWKEWGDIGIDAAFVYAAKEGVKYASSAYKERV